MNFGPFLNKEDIIDVIVISWNQDI
jgi:hypothetical protein